MTIAMWRPLVAAVSAVALLAATAASADARPRKRHAKPPKAMILRAMPVDPQYQAARERYKLLFGGCVSDEGYGRFTPCWSRPD